MYIHHVRVDIHQQETTKGKKMNATTQIPAEDIKPGMKIIPTGKKKAVEVISADNWTQAGRYQFGLMGKGFSVFGAETGSLVTVAL